MQRREGLGDLLEFIEDLHPYESVEDQSFELGDFIRSRVIENVCAGEVEN